MPCRLAPELFAGMKANKASDIFAMGVVLWEIMTMEFPWGNCNPWSIVSSVRDGKRPPIPSREDIRGPVPQQGCYESYVALLKSCWAQQPGDRPGADELLTCLEEIASDQLI